MKVLPVKRVEGSVGCLLLLLGITALAAEAPRAARSVHLSYPAPASSVFCNDVIVDRSVPGSYFMACGWNSGYFGVQELADGRKVILFSVWDPTAGNDPDAVREPDRVTCVYRDPEARIGRFGGEGTGGQCMADFAWNAGETLRFAVEARHQGGRTDYAGYVWLPESGKWRHLATFRVRSGSRLLHGLYSFVEDFRRDFRSAQELRRARFGRGWVREENGAWTALDKATFSASGAEWEAKHSIDAGSEAGWFFLATGGGTRERTPLGSVLEIRRSPAEKRPELPPGPGAGGG